MESLGDSDYVKLLEQIPHNKNTEMVHLDRQSDRPGFTSRNLSPSANAASSTGMDNHSKKKHNSTFHRIDPRMGAKKP